MILDKNGWLSCQHDANERIREASADCRTRLNAYGCEWARCGNAMSGSTPPTSTKTCRSCGTCVETKCIPMTCTMVPRDVSAQAAVHAKLSYIICINEYVSTLRNVIVVNWAWFVFVLCFSRVRQWHNYEITRLQSDDTHTCTSLARDLLPSSFDKSAYVIRLLRFMFSSVFSACVLPPEATMRTSYSVHAKECNISVKFWLICVAISVWWLFYYNCCCYCLRLYECWPCIIYLICAKLFVKSCMRGWNNTRDRLVVNGRALIFTRSMRVNFTLGSRSWRRCASISSWLMVASTVGNEWCNRSSSTSVPFNLSDVRSSANRRSWHCTNVGSLIPANTQASVLPDNNYKSMV